MKPLVNRPVKPFRALTLVIFLGVLLLGTSANAENPLDLFRYLEEWNLTVSMHHETGTPLALLETPVEAYTVRDPPGARYALFMMSPDQLRDQLSLVQLSQAVGLQTVPSWPTIVRRGVNGIPQRAAAEKLFPKGTYLPPAALEQARIPAWVVPNWPKEAPYYEAGETKMSPTQLADLTSALLFAHVTGILHYGTPYVTPEHVVSNLMYGPFKGYDGGRVRSSFREFTRFLNQRKPQYFPTDQLKALVDKPADIALYLARLNLFLSRLESLAGRPETMEALLKPALANVLSTKRAESLSKLIALAKGARGELVAAIGGLHPSLAKLPTPIRLAHPPLFVDLGPRLVEPGTKSPEFAKGWEFHAKDYLLTYTMTPDPMKKQLEGDWAKALAATDPLEKIWEAASVYDNRIGLVHPERIAADVALRENNERQFFLNRGSQRTLLLISVNDAESETIVAIARKIQREINVPDDPDLLIYEGLPKYKQGETLSLADFKKALAHAKAVGAKNLVKCELGANTPEMEKAAKHEGIALVHLDHHSSKMNKLSTLEQFANIWGYQLTLNEYITALVDRSGITGLRHLGFSVADVREYLRRTGQLDRVEEIIARLEAELREGDGSRIVDPNLLIRFRLPGGRLSTVTVPLGYLFYPEHPHILIQGDHTIRFVGPAVIVDKLQESLEPLVPRGRWVTGGDRHSGFLIYLPVGYPDMEIAADTFEATLQKLHEYRCVKSMEASLLDRGF